MKILILASWFPKNGNDPTGRFILDQAQALEKHHDVRLVDCSMSFHHCQSQCS